MVTLCSGFASLVERPADRPARPAPMIIRWIDILDFKEQGFYLRVLSRVKSRSK